MTGRKHVRIGMDGYARVLGHLAEQPGTIGDMKARGVLGHTAANRILPALHRTGILRVCAWETRAYNAPFHAVYALAERGEGDAAPPTHHASGYAVRSTPTPLQCPRVPPELLAFSTLIEAMHEPTSCPELVDETGIYWETMMKAIRVLLKLRLVHIAHWTRRPNGGPYVAHYAWRRNGTNAKRPRADRLATLKRCNDKRRARRQFLTLIPSLRPSASSMASEARNG